jgi:hypothetical protein
MSLKVTLEEEPRVFHVRVGCNSIGKVTSYNDESNDPESYHAARFVKGDDDGEDREETLGWFDTIKEAGEVVVEYAHGSSKIDKVIERIV